MINAETPANPTGYATAFEGLTKREYFAGLAMQAIVSNSKINQETMGRESIARIAINQADALLAELDK